VTPPAGPVRLSPGLTRHWTGASRQLTQAARDGALEAWLRILSQRHPDVIWVPKKQPQ
jgi:hypothetical protein